MASDAAETTPDPADLSDAELCEAVSREVFGLSPRAVDRVEMNWSRIGQVVEAMQERGYRYELLGPNHKGNHVAWFKNPDSRGFEHFPSSKSGAEDEDLARACFEAALAAVRSVET